MIRRIIALSIQNRLLVLLLTLALVVAGIWGTYHLGLDAIPDLSDAQVIIVTNDEGQNPEVIDKQVRLMHERDIWAQPGDGSPQGGDAGPV